MPHTSSLNFSLSFFLCVWISLFDFVKLSFCFLFFFSQLYSSDNKSNVLGISFQVKIFIISEQKVFTAVVQLNYESQR